MKFGGSNSSNLPAYRRYENGGPGPIMPKDHSVTPPTKEQMKKSKGELFERDLTGFKRDDRIGTIEEQKNAKKSITLIDREHVNKQIEEGTFWGWPGWREMFAPSFLRPKHKMGGTPNTDPTKDPTFKAWFAKNARREDVMQSASNPEQLKRLFLNDINFPGNDMPVFSGEMDGMGNIDKSNRDLGLSMQMIGGPQMKNGGEVLPMYNKGGNIYPGGGNRSDYSGVNDRNTNAGTQIGQTVGDSNLLQNLDYVVPGLGTGLDFLADLWGFKGEADQYTDNRRDASESSGTLDILDRDNVNKGTLNLSTRKDALGAMVNFTQVQPTFQNYMAPRMMQTAGAGMSKYAAGQLNSSIKGSGSGKGDVGDVIDYDAISGGTHARYGGNMKDLPVAYKGLPKANMGGRMSSMRDMMTGPTEMETGMDLRNKTKMNFGGGGAMSLGPGMALPGVRAQTMNSGVRNPYGQNALMQATGMAGEQAMEQGGQPPAQYEAEGGEVIMHEPGNQPSTTGNMESLGANEMVSKLEGSSHDNGGEIVQGEGDQYVFSNELKSEKWGNISFSDAAEKIAKNIEKYEESSKEGDDITKSTAESMIQAWTQKLAELRTEQESAREAKFMEMVNSGADQETLMQNFPDLTEQMMAEQTMAQQQPEQNDMPMEQDNPMGNIDMSQLAPEDQELIGARYGLPHYNHGGSHEDFDTYDFNTYTTDDSDYLKLALMGDENVNLPLGKDYKPSKKDLQSILTQNFEDDGAFFHGDIYNDAGSLSDAILLDYDSKRSAHIEKATGLKGKPRRKDYKSTDETTGKTSVDKVRLQQDKAAWSMYNSGLSGNWSENFGADANMSPRKYFKTFYNDLISKGTDPELAATLVEKEKMKKAQLDATNLETETQEKEMSPEDKAAALIEQQQQSIKNKKMLGDIGNGLINMAPTMYNFAKGNEDAEVEQVQRNKNDDEVEQLLRGLTNKDISQELKTNEESFNNLKYLASDMSDGSSANAMNTLLRGQVFKQDADAAVYEAAEESNQANRMVLADYLNKAGENDKAERIRATGINSENRAAVEAFKAKGWEGLSGANQLRQQMEGLINRDEQLKGLLDDIYPDVQKYKTEDGGIDLAGLIKAHPELEEQLKNYFKAAK